MMIATIALLAQELGLDVELCTTIADIALDQYNPDAIGIKKAQGTIILSLK
jgi:hypothetical protein